MDTTTKTHTTEFTYRPRAGAVVFGMITSIVSYERTFFLCAANDRTAEFTLGECVLGEIADDLGIPRALFARKFNAHLEELEKVV